MITVDTDEDEYVHVTTIELGENDEVLLRGFDFVDGLGSVIYSMKGYLPSDYVSEEISFLDNKILIFKQKKTFHPSYNEAMGRE